MFNIGVGGGKWNGATLIAQYVRMDDQQWGPSVMPGPHVISCVGMARAR